MANYRVREINTDYVEVEFDDGQWARVVPTAGMSEEDFDELVLSFKPEPAANLSFLSEGQQRVARQRVTNLDGSFGDPIPEWLSNRLEAYGSAVHQLELIAEQGFDGFVAEVNRIKALFPKPSESE